MTKVSRGLAHLAAMLGLGAWALAAGRWLRDPTVAGGIGLALLLLLVVLALRHLYGEGGIASLRAAAPPRPAAEPAAVAVADPPAPPPLFDHRVDLNAAAAEDLVTLPGIGPVAAQRIIDERDANGPFATVDDLSRVPGFGAAKVRVLADRVRV